MKKASISSSPQSDLEEGKDLKLDFAKLGKTVIPVAVQDVETKEVLVIAYTNKEAFEKTLATKIATFWSTSRGKLWVKGETSGQTLHLVEARVNCEQNSLLYLVKMAKPISCHTGRKSCFYRKIEDRKLKKV